MNRLQQLSPKGRLDHSQVVATDRHPVMGAGRDQHQCKAVVRLHQAVQQDLLPILLPWPPTWVEREKKTLDSDESQAVMMILHPLPPWVHSL
jgi:hypothetical protein